MGAEGFAPVLLLLNGRRYCTEFGWKKERKLADCLQGACDHISPAFNGSMRIIQLERRNDMGNWGGFLFLR
jgi:hypothetical protein